MTAEASILNTSPDLPEQDRPHAPQFCDSSSAEATGSSNSSLRVEKRRLSSSSAQPLTSVQHPDHIPSLPVKKKLRLSDEQRVSTIADAVSTILACLEDDPLREGLVKTPLRYAKALLSLTEGYFKDTKEVVGDAEFDEDHTESVLVRNVDIFSLCEHHLLPFNGYCHVAYVPNGTVIGLSKIARIIDLFSRRLQVQERLTSQIADAVQEATNAQGVMVYISCSHMCMAMRGVRKAGSSTVTTATRGHYANDSELRREFLSSISAATHVR